MNFDYNFNLMNFDYNLINFDYNFNLINFDYNFNYNVNYFNISQELLDKLRHENKNKNEYSDSDTNSIGYTEDDVDTICRKLYIDEYSNVFNTKNYMDDKIDKTLKQLFNFFLDHFQLNNFINNIFQIYKNEIYKNTNFDDEDENDIKYISFLGLFSYNTFYLTHQLIKNIGNNETIDYNLLNNISKEFHKSLQ
jgi:hypothetical protein